MTAQAKKTTAKDKTDDTLATAILVAALLKKGHSTMSSIELAKNMVEMLREPT